MTTINCNDLNWPHHRSTPDKPCTNCGDPGWTQITTTNNHGLTTTRPGGLTMYRPENVDRYCTECGASTFVVSPDGQGRSAVEIIKGKKSGVSIVTAESKNGKVVMTVTSHNDGCPIGDANPWRTLPEPEDSTPSPTPPHLTPIISERGFKHMPPIRARGNEVVVYESSRATAPHIWLSVCGSAASLTLDEARQLSEQLDWLADHHYQVESEDV